MSCLYSLPIESYIIEINMYPLASAVPVLYLRNVKIMKRLIVWGKNKKKYSGLLHVHFLLFDIQAQNTVINVLQISSC